jgi:sugar phosphate permease
MTTRRTTQVTDDATPQKGKVFYGWWIAVSAAVLRFFSGGYFYYGFSVFFNPIRETFGWSAADTSVAFTLRGVETGLFSPVVGAMADRFAPRKLMVIGWTIIGLGFIVMSRINSIWTFYGSFVLVAFGSSLGVGLVMNTTIANWFTKKRSRALAIGFIGPGASGLLAPVLAFSLGEVGWRQTLLFMGISSMAIGIPLTLLFRDRPQHYGYLPDGEVAMPSQAQDTAARATPGFSAKAALKTRAFWMISTAQLFQQMGTSAVSVHIVPYLESAGVPTAVAALSVTGMTVCSLIGRLGFGVFGDYRSKRHLIALSIALQIIGLGCFAFVTRDAMWLLVAFLLTYGPGFGGPIPLWPGLQADFFGTRSFGTIMGLLTLTSVIGGLASPIVAGWIFDVTGSYRVAWELSLLVTLPAIPLMLLNRPPSPAKTPAP